MKEKLISADALMKEFAEFVKESNNSDFADVPTWNDAVSLLGSAPTVEAIPKEWIKKKAKEHEHYGESGKFCADVILSLVELWEKENGKTD